MSFDGAKQISGAPPPAPVKGTAVLSWAKRLVRWAYSERILWGAGFVVTPGPHGKAVEFLPGSGNRAFTVSRVTASTISIKGGYAQTQTGALSAVASVESVAVSANLAVFARYDLGLAGTSTPGWEVVSGSIIQTAAALPSYDARYRVVPIAAVTWDGTSSAISGIVQHHTGNLECPDMIPAGTVGYFTGTTVPHGWKLHTASEERTIVGYKSGSADYGAIGNTGGTDSHTLNLSHKHTLRGQSSGPGPAATATSCYHFDTAETPCSDNAAEWCSDSISDTSGEITIDNRQRWYVLARMEHL